MFAEWGHQLSPDLPLSPRATAALVADLFHGIEIELLAGVSPQEAPHREVLDAFGDMIERAEKADYARARRYVCALARLPQTAIEHHVREWLREWS